MVFFHLNLQSYSILWWEPSTESHRNLFEKSDRACKRYYWVEHYSQCTSLAHQLCLECQRDGLELRIPLGCTTEGSWAPLLMSSLRLTPPRVSIPAPHFLIHAKIEWYVCILAFYYVGTRVYGNHMIQSRLQIQTLDFSKRKCLYSQTILSAKMKSIWVN